MTEHESEQLYHELRRKLEGYGSAPPEDMWANIQQQLPKKPRRNWQPLLILLLVGTALGCLTVGTRAWRQRSTTSVASASTKSESTLSSRTAARTSAVWRAVPPTPSSSVKAGTPRPGTAEAPALAARNDVAGSSEITRPALAESASGEATSARTLGQPSGKLLPPSHRQSLSITPEYGQLAAVGRREKTSKKGADREPLKLGQGAVAGAILPKHGQRVPFKVQQGSGSLAQAATPHSAAKPTTNKRNPLALASAAASTSRPEAPGSGQGAYHQSLAKRLQGFAPVSNEPLPLLAVQVAIPEPEEPEVVRAKRKPRARPTRSELLLRNWRLELLAGTGLTYRALGGAPTQLERLERPGTGFSGQVSGAYAFTPQLTVSAGLGYAEYSTGLRYQLKKTSWDTTLAVDFRDVYRFVTIPVQAQYTLKGNHRWRVGVLGGGTVALLTSARTTEGSACNCSQRQWQSSGAGTPVPFKNTNLVLNVGAFANYQFAPGQWLTIRPQGQLFLNSLTTPASGRAARRPWSLGLQAGYAWDLDPRKR